MPCSYLDVTEIHPKISGSIYVVRFLTEPSKGEWSPFEGVCTVDTTGKVSRVYGMCGRVRLRHLRALVEWFLGIEVTEVHAHRAPLHVLPGAKKDGDWMVIDLLALKKRV